VQEPLNAHVHRSVSGFLFVREELPARCSWPAPRQMERKFRLRSQPTQAASAFKPRQPFQGQARPRPCQGIEQFPLTPLGSHVSMGRTEQVADDSAAVSGTCEVKPSSTFGDYLEQFTTQLKVHILEQFTTQFKAHILEQHVKDITSMSSQIETLQAENAKLRDSLDKLRELHIKITSRKHVTAFQDSDVERSLEGDRPVSPNASGFSLLRSAGRARDLTPRPPPVPPQFPPKLPKAAPRVLLVSQVAPSALETLPFEAPCTGKAADGINVEAATLTDDDESPLPRKDAAIPAGPSRLRDPVGAAIVWNTPSTVATESPEEATAAEENHEPDVTWASEKSENRRRVSVISSHSETSVPSFFEHKPAVGRIWMLLEDPTSSRAAAWIATCSNYFIGIAVLVTLLQSTNPPVLYGLPVAVAEIVFESLFFLECLARYLACHSTCVFFKSPYNIIDILAILPLAVRALQGLVPPTEAEAPAMHYILFCAVPIVRLLKLFRRIQKFHVFVHTFSLTLEALKVLLCLLALFILFFSSLIYMIEPSEVIDSMPTAIWMSTVTVATVGYGDVTPSTPGGRLVCGLLVLSSVLYMAMPISIVGDAFMKTWADRHRLLVMIRTRDRLKQWGYTAFDMPGLFQRFDANGNGELSLEEFRDMIAKMGIGMKAKEATELFELFDADGSGGIDEQEFMRALFPDAYHQIYGGRRSSSSVSP